MMTRRIETRTGAARAASSIRWTLGCWALLGGFACQNAAEPQLQGEPARTASGTHEPAAAPPAPHSATEQVPKAEPAAPPSSAAAPSAPPVASAPSAQVGLAKYEEPRSA